MSEYSGLRRSSRERRPPDYLTEYELNLSSVISEANERTVVENEAPGKSLRTSHCSSDRSRQSKTSLFSRLSARSRLSDEQLSHVKRIKSEQKLEEIMMRQREDEMADDRINQLDEEAFHAQETARRVLREREKLQTRICRARELRQAKDELCEASMIESMLKLTTSTPSIKMPPSTATPSAPTTSLPTTSTLQASRGKPVSATAQMMCNTLTTSSTHTRPTVQVALPTSATPHPPTLRPRVHVQSTREIPVNDLPRYSTPSVVNTPWIPLNPPAPTPPQGVSELLISSSYGLPKPSLPTFDTDNEKDFRLLKMSFENLIDCHSHLSEKYKYQILMDHLGGNAKKLACAYLGHATPYTMALLALNEKYGRPRQLVLGELNSILSLPFVKSGDHAALDNFALSVQSLVGILSSIEGESSVELRCGSHVDKLLTKLPSHLQTNFIEYCLNHGILTHEAQSTYTLVHLNGWLQAKSRASRIAQQAVSSVKTEPRPQPNHDRGSRPPRSQRPNLTVSSLNTVSKSNPTRSEPAVPTDRKQTFKFYCAFCNSEHHHICFCESFKKLKVDEVISWIKNKKRCWKCGRSHSPADCNLKRPCSICQKLHLTILHDSVQKSSTQSYALNQSPLYLDKPSHSYRVILKVVPVILHGTGGKTLETYAVLDDGSMRTMIMTPAVRQLDLTTDPEDIILTTIRSEPFNCPGYSVNLTISPRDDPNRKYPIRNAFASNQLALSEYSHPVKSLQREYAHLQDAVLPDINKAKPLILIGSDHADLILPQTPIRFGPSNAPVAVCTNLGWTLQGLSSDTTSAQRDCLLTSVLNPSAQLMNDVEKLWKAEVIPFTSKAVTRSKLDNMSVKVLETKTVKVRVGDTDHYATPLLRKPDCPLLRADKESVMGNLRSVEKRLQRNPDLADIHNQKIQELVDKGYVQIISDSEAASTPESWFIPHHVIRQHDKYRLVFNCSYESSGQALNNHLLPGPNLCSSLLGVFLRFRQQPVAISGDIQAMFHQIRLLPEDRCLLRFLWRNLQKDREPDVYEWKVLPFGTTCSPCCSAFALRKHAIDNQIEYPEVAQSILQSFYVDNCLESVSNIIEAKERIAQMRKVLASGGFNMRQWASNNQEVVKDLPADAKSESCELWLAQENEDPKESTLGLSWNCVEDVISYKHRPITYPQLTMKVVYRILASQYDPLGYLSPYLSRAKVLVRDLWIKKRKWDEPIEPGQILQDWNNWESELCQMSTISLPRCYHTNSNIEAANLQLHIFCDASEKVYGAIAYLRIEDEVGNYNVAFVSARSRVAPKKCLSVPRLELCAALLGSQLSETVTNELSLPITSVTLWSDSTTVLSWLKSDSCRYKVFVGTRVAEIQNLTEVHSWRYVNTRDNPADDITRGLTLSELSSPESRWRHGPSFLTYPAEQWPLGKMKFVEIQSELKKTFCGVTLPSKPTTHEDWDSAIESVRSSMCTSDGAAAPETDTRDIEIELFRQIQKESFPEDLAALSTGKPLSSSSRLLQLSPECEPETGLIRVGGRLRNASDIPSELKHPIVLDPKHPLTKLLIKHFDVKTHHYGSERLFAELRRQFWILRGREAVKRHQRQCFDCQRWRASPETPKMADLPPARLRIFKPPFYSTGVDCFGPMYIKIGRRREKRFGVIFKCLTTRAVHLDLLESMDTDAFLMALRRFISRRGKPHEILSDCGTNFKGGERELSEAFKSMNPILAKCLTKQQIEFKFNPPYAPHFGGTWEREIRSVKHGLRTVLGIESVHENTLRTVLFEVEAILNSKPLGYVSSDVADVDPITPFSLLIGRPDPSLPQVVYPAEQRLGKSRWRHCQTVADQFWKKFIQFYLPSLQLRDKWFKDGLELKVGDPVLIADSQQVRGLWPVGRIVDVCPSPDGRIRSAVVRVSGGDTYHRPVTKLVLLPELP